MLLLMPPPKFSPFWPPNHSGLSLIPPNLMTWPQANFSWVKSELSGASLGPDSFIRGWTKFFRIMRKKDYETAYRRWLECFKKCIQIGGEYV
jgi:hypothetical protein